MDKETADAKKELRHIQKQTTTQLSDVQCTQRKCNHLQLEKKEKEEYLKQHRYEMAYCQHYLDIWPPGEAPEWAAFALGELPHQPITPTVDPLLGTEGSASSGQDPTMGEDVEMRDDTPLGAVGGEEATGGDSLVNKEDEALLNEYETPQTQVLSNMRNLTVCSPANVPQSQTETKR